LAQEKLKSDLEKKKRKEAEKRRQFGIDTPPDLNSLTVTEAGRKLKQRQHKKAKHGKHGSPSKGIAGVGGSDSESDTNAIAAFAAGREGEDGGEGYMDGFAFVGENNDADDSGNDINENDKKKEKSERVGGEEVEEEDDEDSLDGLLRGIRRHIPQQTGQQPASPQLSPSKSNATSTKSKGSKSQAGKKAGISGENFGSSSTSNKGRSSSAGANEHVSTANSALSNGTRGSSADHHSNLPARPRNRSFADDNVSGHNTARGEETYGHANISTAHEEFQELDGGFEVDDFFSQDSAMVPVIRANRSGKLVQVSDNGDNRSAPNSANSFNGDIDRRARRYQDNNGSGEDEGRDAEDDADDEEAGNKVNRQAPGAVKEEAQSSEEDEARVHASSRKGRSTSATAAAATATVTSGKAQQQQKAGKGSSKAAITIPKNLQNTPYFASYKKHLAHSHSSTAGAAEASDRPENSSTLGAAVSTKVPLLAHKLQKLQQQQQQEQTHHAQSQSTPNLAAASAAVAPFDIEEAVEFQQHHNMKYVLFFDS
jgi:hypothetical protein